MIDWSGIYHILATPFLDDGGLDAEGIPRLVDAVLGSGVTGITILGIAGEAHRLTDEERRRVVDAVVKEVRGRVPVAVGVSAAGTHLAAAFAVMAREHGADAVMVAPPAGARNLDAVAEYYQAVAAAARLPVVLQDEPVTTQVTMPPAFLARLIAEVDAAQAVKLEEAPTPPKITRLRALAARPIPIFGGLGGVYFFEELSRGAVGAMTGFPYPEALRMIHEHFVAGRRNEARSVFYQWLPLIRYESQPGSVPGTSMAIRKEILRRRGWIRSARVRPPAAALDAATLEELTEIMTAVGTA
jgi:4-hydroxy-tetrahydrodipicolinate synthase